MEKLLQVMPLGGNCQVHINAGFPVWDFLSGLRESSCRFYFMKEICD